MPDWVVVLLVIAVAISTIASVALNIRNRQQGGDETAFWKVMALLAVPAAIGLAGLAILLAKRGIDIPDEIPSSAPGPDRLEEAENLERVLTEKAAEEAEHIRETATDDEVASTGAAMFDPGVDD